LTKQLKDAILKYSQLPTKELIMQDILAGIIFMGVFLFLVFKFGKNAPKPSQTERAREQQYWANKENQEVNVVSADDDDKDKGVGYGESDSSSDSGSDSDD
jgi:hypothetical protein